MPYDVQIKPPTFYISISGDKIGQNSNQKYKALMCGNPNTDYLDFKALSVFHYQNDLPSSSYNEASFNDTTYMSDTFYTCKEIMERSYIFSNGFHINDTEESIIKKNS